MVEERKKLEQDIRNGKIFDKVEPSGQGRGVAMTLPAWMTEVGSFPASLSVGKGEIVQIVYSRPCLSEQTPHTIMLQKTHGLLKRMSIPGAAFNSMPCWYSASKRAYRRFGLWRRRDCACIGFFFAIVVRLCRISLNSEKGICFRYVDSYRITRFHHVVLHCPRCSS